MSGVKRIVGGTVWSHTGPAQADVIIGDDGRIARVIPRKDDVASGEDRVATPPHDRVTVDQDGLTIDARGLWIFPGVIDTHVHFRDPGLTEKEDFLSGSKAALLSGVTTVLDMPNTVPPVATGRDFREKKAAISGRSWVDYGLFGVLTPAGIEEGVSQVEALVRRVEQLIDEGACAIKVFMGPTTGNIHAPDWGELYDVFRHFSGSDVVFTFHAEDRSTIDVATTRLLHSAKQGDVDLTTYDALLNSRPRFGELMATEAALKLSLTTDVRVHIAHVALREAVDSIARAKSDGARVTAETCPQYLFLSEDDYDAQGRMMKVLPPIRSRDDQNALWEGLRSGVIDMISTDHAPHQKAPYHPDEPRESALEGPFGAAGVETLLPLMVDACIEGRISAPDVVNFLATQPANAYSLSRRKGAISPGLDGDVAIIDPHETYVIGEKWAGKSANTPFNGRTVTGKTVMTVLKGSLKMKDGHLLGEPTGKLI